MRCSKPNSSRHEGISYSYDFGVDNHPHDERLAAKLTGIGFIGKTSSSSTRTMGPICSLGIVFIDLPILKTHTRSRGFMRHMHALHRRMSDRRSFEGGYDVTRCMSAYNQSKKPLSDTEIVRRTPCSVVISG